MAYALTLALLLIALNALCMRIRRADAVGGLQQPRHAGLSPLGAGVRIGDRHAEKPGYPKRAHRGVGVLQVATKALRTYVDTKRSLHLGYVGQRLTRCRQHRCKRALIPQLIGVLPAPQRLVLVKRALPGLPLGKPFSSLNGGELIDSEPLPNQRHGRQLVYSSTRLLISRVPPNPLTPGSPAVDSQ